MVQDLQVLRALLGLLQWSLVPKEIQDLKEPHQPSQGLRALQVWPGLRALQVQPGLRAMQVRQGLKAIQAQPEQQAY
jgi:hypothetical protein